RGPLKEEHWDALLRAIPALTHAELERAAETSRPLEIDLPTAPPRYQDLALALARRFKRRNLTETELARLMNVLKRNESSSARRGLRDAWSLDGVARGIGGKRPPDVPTERARSAGAGRRAGMDRSDPAAFWGSRGAGRSRGTGRLRRYHLSHRQLRVRDSGAGVDVARPGP